MRKPATCDMKHAQQHLEAFLPIMGFKLKSLIKIYIQWAGTSEIRIEDE
jgi:hypothetical protein